ncbi:MAG: NifU N-terminal domain-containing protein [Planctomycetota bacterium]
MPTVTPQSTPNPNAMKFTIAGHSFDAPRTISAADAEATPFAAAIFALPGVVSLFCTADFVTVTKDSSAAWDNIVPAAQAALEENF